MRWLLVIVLAVLCLSSAQLESEPRLIFQIGAFNAEAGEESLFFRFWIVGGKFDSDESSTQFGRVEYGALSVTDPAGSLIFQTSFDNADPREVQSFVTAQPIVPGVYRADVAFIHGGELEQLSETVTVSEEDAIAVPSIRIEEVSAEGLSLSWADVAQAAVYEVALVNPALGRSGTLLRRDVTELSLNLDFSALEANLIEPGTLYQVVVTALSRADAESGQISGSESSALVRFAQNVQNEASSPGLRPPLAF